MGNSIKRWIGNKLGVPELKAHVRKLQRENLGLNLEIGSLVWQVRDAEGQVTPIKWALTEALEDLDYEHQLQTYLGTRDKLAMRRENNRLRHDNDWLQRDNQRLRELLNKKEEGQA